MDKAADAFRTISEVAEDLGIPKHVLRFWEVKFAQIKPMKRGGGRRYYRPEDLDLLKGVQHLLHRDGYTIKGVQKILREQGTELVKQLGRGEKPVTWPLNPVDDGERVTLGATDEPSSGTGRGSARPGPGASRLSARARRVSRPGGDAAGRATATERLKALRSIIAALEECHRILGGAPPAQAPKRRARG